MRGSPKNQSLHRLKPWAAGQHKEEELIANRWHQAEKDWAENLLLP